MCGEKDTSPWASGEGFFVEIRFNDPEKRVAVADEEMRDRLITADYH